MAGVKVKTTKMTHKDGKPRRKLAKTRVNIRGRYSMDGYYYDDGMSHRRGRAANGRFVSRDGSEMARKLREMMADAPDDASRQKIQRLAERMEQM